MLLIFKFRIIFKFGASLHFTSCWRPRDSLWREAACGSSLSPGFIDHPCRTLPLFHYNEYPQFNECLQQAGHPHLCRSWPMPACCFTISIEIWTARPGKDRGFAKRSPKTAYACTNCIVICFRSILSSLRLLHGAVAK